MNTPGDTFREFTQTKERATAWVFRILITLVGVAGTTVLWLGWYTLTDVKDGLKTQGSATWAAIAAVSKSEEATASAVSVMQREVEDHIAQETEINTELKQEEKDHEDRIRGLERSK